MNNDTRNNSSNSNWYRELADGDKDDIGSLQNILNNSIIITTVQAIAEEAEVQQLELEIAQEFKLLNTDINQVSKALSTLIDKDEDKLAFEEKDDNKTVLPTLKMEEEFQGKVLAVIVRDTLELFKDQVSNILATSSHPNHSGSCAHLLDIKDRYQDRIGNNQA